MKARFPLMVTMTPSSVVGALMPLKSSPPQERVVAARLSPLISSQEPDAKVAEPPKPEAVRAEEIDGCATPQVGGGAVAVLTNWTGARFVPETVAVTVTGPAVAPR